MAIYLKNTPPPKGEPGMVDKKGGLLSHKEVDETVLTLVSMIRNATPIGVVMDYVPLSGDISEYFSLSTGVGFEKHGLSDWVLCHGGTLTLEGGLEVRIPDFRGRASVGCDPDDPRIAVAGQTGGDDGLLPIRQLPAHRHNIPPHQHKYEVGIFSESHNDWAGNTGLPWSGLIRKVPFSWNSQLPGMGGQSDRDNFLWGLEEKTYGSPRFPSEPSLLAPEDTEGKYPTEQEAFDMPPRHVGVYKVMRFR